MTSYFTKNTLCIGETLSWYRNSCQNGKLAESEIKIESVKFFKLSGDDLNRNKKMFKLSLEKLVRKDANFVERN